MSREVLQQTIDSEIKSLEESVRALKLRRNQLSPISSLPPEVFLAIFSLLWPGGGRRPDSDNDHLTRLSISHVCHQWREIALDIPLLWSHVDFFAQAAAGTAEILARAKSAPLYFEASAGHRWDDVRFSTFQNELRTRAAHICHLRISAKPLYLQRAAKELVSPAPTLEYLELTSHSSGRSRRRIWVPSARIPDTLFNGCTPRLSHLELRCDISWKSPLLKGLKHLEIITPFGHARPLLTVWLDALGEMTQLKTLILREASPIARYLPFDVERERVITLPSLNRFDISGSLVDCTLALAYLDLPALTTLCLSAIFSRKHGVDVKTLVPYIARHAHGLQDTQPLQSVLIRSEKFRIEILAWPVPDIDVQVYNQPAKPLPTRMALAFKGRSLSFDEPLVVLAGLPLSGLVVLSIHKLSRRPHNNFWLHHSPKWPLLQRVLLSPYIAPGLIEMLKDDGGRGRPLLPSLTELIMVDFSLYDLTRLSLPDALRARVEQGVPVKRVDLRICHDDVRAGDWLQNFSESFNVLVPEEFPARQQMRSMWWTVARGPFVNDEDGWSISDDEDE